MKFDELEYEYTMLLQTMEVRPEWKDAIDRRARAILANKAAYQKIAEVLGMPWEMIGVIHSLESGMSFTKHLHNGDPLTARTRLVPRGHPKVGTPPFTWEESAVDALKIKSFDKVEEWSDERICYELERYNGFGYRLRRTGVHSPYLWSGTFHYTVGKFVSDGKYVKTAKSAQTGAIPLLKRIREIDIDAKEIVKNSSKLTMFKRLRIFITTTFGGLFTGLSFDTTKQYLELAGQFALQNWFWMLGGTAGILWLIFKWAEFKQVEDYKDGRYVPSGQRKEE